MVDARRSPRYGCRVPQPDPAAVRSTDPTLADDRLLSPMPPPAQTPGARAATERAELQVQTLRLRTSLAIGFFIWCSFSLADILLSASVYPGTRSWLLACRAAGAAAILAGWLRLRFGRPPSWTGLRALDCVEYTTAAVVLAVMSIRAGGIGSVTGAGVVLVLLCHSLTIAYPWKRNLLIMGIPAVAYPLTHAAAAPFSPAIAAQFDDQRELTLFFYWTLCAAAAFVFQLVGGHFSWLMRMELLELKSGGRYRLKVRLGSGSMGEVWAAWDQALRRDVALKLIRAPDVSPTAIARFEREVKASIELKHPNTIRVFDCGTTEDGHWFYAMELLAGEDLARLVAREGPIDPERAARIVHQAARALGEAHAHGIVHRDVKPANIFLSTVAGEIDFVKVLDFGIAKMVGSDAPATLTERGALLGTPGYIPPEVIHGRPADARSDIYSLGAVLYFLLAGRKPFEEDDIAAVLFAHVHGALVSPSKKRGAPIPAALEAIAARCLAKSPDERYATAGELAQALALALGAAISGSTVRSDRLKTA